MKTLLSVSVLATLAATAAAANINLPPYTFTGRVMTYDRMSLAETTSGAEIRVRKAADGSLLAFSQILRQEHFTENYRLQVPLSLVESPTTAATNTVLAFEVQTGNRLYTTASLFPTNLPSCPGGLTVCDVILGEDLDGNGIADAYETLMNEDEIPYYRAMGLDIGPTYDPEADYDGDGVSNRLEYLAGTDPFLKEDVFSIRSFEPSPVVEGAWVLTFFANRAHTYGTQTTESLDAEPFAQTTFAPAAAPESRSPVLHTSKTDYGLTSVLVFPAAEQSAAFFRLTVQ